MPRLAGTRLLPLCLHHAVGDDLIDQVRVRVDETAGETREEIGAAIQDQATGMPGDGDPDFIGYLESATADEHLLVEEHIDPPPQFCLQVTRHLAVQRNVALENLHESRRELPCIRPCATRALKPRRNRPHKDQDEHQQDQEQYRGRNANLLLIPSDKYTNLATLRG